MTDKKQDVAQSSIAQNEIEFTMPSRLELLVVLDSLVSSICRELEFDEESSNAIANSVIEAATNAVQHGHEHDEERPVRFTFVLAEDRLEVRVQDFGEGFDLEEVNALDPTGPEGLFKSRGRGIFIMRAMMDRLDFEMGEGDGATVILTKMRSGAIQAES